jgi:hypothetical protein
VACARLGATLAALAVLATAQAQGVVGEWSQVPVPPAPALHEVTVNPSQTVLLVMDMAQAGCSQEPRCTADVPHIKLLLDQARSHHDMLVVFTGSPTMPFVSDIAPQHGEAIVPGRGPDKFYNTNLGDLLKSHGVTTVIACGRLANGAVLFTVFAAAARGYHIVVPVDCITGGSAASRADPGRGGAYAEQSVVWGMANDPGLAPFGAGGGRPPGGQTGYTTLTSSNMIHFG